MKAREVRVIQDGDVTEIQWGEEGNPTGYILVHPDGTATFPHGDGFVIMLAGDDTRVVLGEDQYAGRVPGEVVLWEPRMSGALR